MLVTDLQPGDVVYAAATLRNDGSLPGVEADSIIAETGRRGVIINSGHLEDEPARVLYLVRFENDDRKLGPPIGCWPEELTGETEHNGP